MGHYTEADLENLVEEKLQSSKECAENPEVCKLIQTPIGKARVIERIKQIILLDGITDVESAIAQLETELIFSTEND